MENIKIPYIVIDTRGKGETNIECYSVCKEDLEETLLKVLQECMEYHEFCFVDEEKLFEVDSVSKEELESEKSLESVAGLECDECGCQVVLEKYITIVNEVKYCGACKPSITIDKSIYDRFQKFLDRNSSVSEIWYFEDGDWLKFMIE
jgi:formylmethanofuran dehydrogenase subunit E